MVIDCRRSNYFCEEPAEVSLCSGDALGRIELDGDDELFITSADLKDAFYHLLSPADLRRFFGMRGVSASDLGIQEIGGKPIPPVLIEASPGCRSYGVELGPLAVPNHSRKKGQ